MDSTVRYAVLAATISSELSGRLAKRPAINPVPRFDSLSYALPEGNAATMSSRSTETESACAFWW